ncbi:gamma-glutamylcyclotransferase-like [Lineus longissimus]|uniref:gamma-glutamylcyclotransferase-like n=1 Tax=Lineus longissimus TaxID=88925 RepID=UPI002B4DA3A7
MAKTFYYFGYGSNLFKQRLHLASPSAVFVSPAKLENYKLRFGKTSKRWEGAVATVIETPGDHVWGAVWKIDQKHRQTLDEQEEVLSGWYRPIEVDVTAAKDGSTVKCISYQLTTLYGPLDSPDAPPPDKPSPHYKDVIVRGAAESALPKDYIEKLKSIKDNGFCGTIDLYDLVVKGQTGS